jgi:hypothetical protein
MWLTYCEPSLSSSPLVLARLRPPPFLFAISFAPMRLTQSSRRFFNFAFLRARQSTNFAARRPNHDPFSGPFARFDGKSFGSESSPAG